MVSNMITRLKQDQRGVAALEFAIVIPVLLMLFSGIVQFGMVMFLQSHMANVARDTTRQVAVGHLTPANAETSAQAALINWGVTYNINVASVDLGGATDFTTSISLPKKDAALIDLLGLFENGNITASVTMRGES